MIGILASLLRLLPGGSAGRIRTLVKFVERDYEKISKIIKLRRQYAGQILTVDKIIKDEQSALSAEGTKDMADQWLLRRLDAGLFCLQVGELPDSYRVVLLTLSVQTIDVILAWLVAEDDGARRRIEELLADHDESLSIVKATLQGKRSPSFPCSPILTSLAEQLGSMGKVDSDGDPSAKEMLETLLKFL